MAAIEKPSICGICPGGCGIIATIDEGKLVSVKPHQGSPYGSLCVRGQAAADVVYSPGRLNTPVGVLLSNRHHRCIAVRRRRCGMTSGTA